MDSCHFVTLSESLLVCVRMYVLAGGDTCFYGVCYYCKPEDAACARGSLMEGAVVLWLPHQMKLKTWRHPYQRTYRDGVQAR